MDEFLRLTFDTKTQEKLENLDRKISRIEKSIRQCNGEQELRHLNSSFETIIKFMQRQIDSSNQFVAIDEMDLEIDQLSGDIGIVGDE